MNVRLRFEKTGNMKFIGHLDVMRYFQKVNRRAGVDIAFSAGFSPHQIMSFASPLGLGLTSSGEYLDMEVKSTGTSAEMLERMNREMADGMRILSYRLLPEGAKNAMSIVAAADYALTVKDGYDIPFWNEGAMNEFFGLEEIWVLKKTKKSEKTVDIQPLILSQSFSDGALYLKLASGSEKNLKPELVLQAMSGHFSVPYNESAYNIHREEMYALDASGELISLDSIGTDITVPICRADQVSADE